MKSRDYQLKMWVFHLQKRGMRKYGPSYKGLLEDGASPYDDYHKGYNGMLADY
jgi:hypothetical protein